MIFGRKTWNIITQMYGIQTKKKKMNLKQNIRICLSVVSVNKKTWIRDNKDFISCP